MKEKKEKCEEKLFAFGEIKKYTFALPPLHSEEPNSEARNVNYRSSQGSSSSSVRRVCEETVLFAGGGGGGGLVGVVVFGGGNMATPIHTTTKLNT
jgi:hypothetical protein